MTEIPGRLSSSAAAFQRGTHSVPTYVHFLDDGPSDPLSDLLLTGIAGILLPRVIERFLEDVLSVLGKIGRHFRAGGASA